MVVFLFGAGGPYRDSTELKLGAAKIVVSAELRLGTATCVVEAPIARPLPVLRRPERQQPSVADVMPAARYRRCFRRNPLAPADGTRGVCRHARERADFALFRRSRGELNRFERERGRRSDDV